MKKTALMADMLALSLATALAVPAAAQSHDDHTAPNAGSAASDAYREANQRMHEGMMLGPRAMPTLISCMA